MAHLKGDAEDGTDVIGIFPLLPNAWKEEIDTLREICKINGIDALVERSGSGRGAHVWIFFQKPIEASLARKFGNTLLRKGMESVNLKLFRYYDRMLPMQEHLLAGGVGNLISLPLQGQALKEGNSAFIDEDWNAYSDQWQVLFSKQKLTKEFVEEKIKEWKVPNPIEVTELAEIREGSDEKPWDKNNRFAVGDVDGELRMILADGIYVEASNLKARIQNQIRELAAFKNPVFFKNQAMGLSNFANTRYIYLGRDENGYIRIPRGLLENLLTE